MSSFNYTANDLSGQSVKGVIDAESEEQAITQLAASNLTVVSIEQRQSGRFPLFSNLFNRQRGEPEGLPQFKYKALNAEGEQSSDQLEAANLADAINQLHDSGLSVLSIRQHETGFSPQRQLRQLANQRSPGTEHKANFFRQMAMMLQGGHTLTEGLVLAAEMTDRKPLQDGIVDMLIRLQQGGSNFANALEAQGKLFPAYVPRFIAVGERTRSLPEALERVADYMEKESQQRAQFLYSMAYPIIILLVAFSVFIGLSLFILPQLADVVRDDSTQLPAVTRQWINLSVWLVDYGLFAAGLFVASIVTLLVSYQAGTIKKPIDRLLLRTPFIGTSITYNAMTQLGWSVSSLLQSGQSIVEALEFCAEHTKNHYIAQSLLNATAAITDGRSLSYGLDQPHLPRFVRQMCAVGERSGELEKATRSVGEYFQRASSRRAEKVSSLAEPVMILLVGGMVAFVYISFFKTYMVMNGAL